MVEAYIGELVKDVVYEHFRIIDQWADATPGKRTLVRALKRAGGAIWGGSAIETASKEVPGLCALRHKVEEILTGMVEGR